MTYWPSAAIVPSTRWPVLASTAVTLAPGVALATWPCRVAVDSAATTGAAKASTAVIASTDTPVARREL